MASDEKPSTGRRRRRDAFAVVGAASRDAIDRTLADPAAPPGALRVLLALIREVSTYSRTSDDLSRRRVAELAGVSERTATRSLEWLSAVGAIEWTPGNRRRRSSVRLGPEADHEPSDSETSRWPAETSTNASASETPERPTEADSQRDTRTPLAGHADTHSGTPECPTPEKTSEKNPLPSENRVDVALDALAAHDLAAARARGVQIRSAEKYRAAIRRGRAQNHAPTLHHLATTEPDLSGEQLAARIIATENAPTTVDRHDRQQRDRERRENCVTCEGEGGTYDASTNTFTPCPACHPAAASA